MIWRFFLHKHVFLYIFFYFPNVFYAPAGVIVTPWGVDLRAVLVYACLEQGYVF